MICYGERTESILATAQLRLILLFGAIITYIHTYFIFTFPKGLFRNNDYITLFIIN